MKRLTNPWLTLAVINESLFFKLVKIPLPGLNVIKPLLSVIYGFTDEEQGSFKCIYSIMPVIKIIYY